jgi:hypothetical protein
VPRKTSHELRCFCGRKPLLAVYGLDERNKLYIHIKIWKQERIFGEILVTDGVVKIHCRECLRWHTVVILKPGLAKLEETVAPSMIIAS